MKNRQKQGCNQKQSAHEDVTAVLPMKTRQKLHRYIFLGIKGVGGNRNKHRVSFCVESFNVPALREYLPNTRMMEAQTLAALRGVIPSVV